MTLKKNLSTVPGNIEKAFINIDLLLLLLLKKKLVKIITSQQSIETSITLCIMNNCIMLNVSIFSLDGFIWS